MITYFIVPFRRMIPERSSPSRVRCLLSPQIRSSTSTPSASAFNPRFRLNNVLHLSRRLDYSEFTLSRKSGAVHMAQIASKKLGPITREVKDLHPLLKAVLPKLPRPLSITSDSYLLCMKE